MAASSTASRVARSAGRSSARNTRPLDVPPRMAAQRMAVWAHGVVHVVDVAQPCVGEPAAHVVEVEAEFAGGQPRPLGRLVGLAVPGGLEHRRGLLARHDHAPRRRRPRPRRRAGRTRRRRRSGSARSPASPSPCPGRRSPSTRPGSPSRSASATSRTPASMTSPRTPWARRLAASRSPTYPSSHGLVGVTTSRSPGCACSTATWIDQLSPGATSQVSALPATRAGRKIGRMSRRSSPVRPWASCTVATPASARPSTTSRSVRGVFRTTSGT